MKSKVIKPIRTVLLVMIPALMTLAPILGHAADNKAGTSPPATLPAAPELDPATGLPVPTSRASRLSSRSQSELDPNTGLPAPPALPPWKDPNWKDPDKVLPGLEFDGLPLGEVGKILRERFNDAFDVLFPNGWQHPSDPSTRVNPQTDFVIKMQLKNVTASEIF